MDDHQTPPGGDEELREDAALETTEDAGLEHRESDAGLEFRQRRAEMLRGTMERREFAVGDMECRTLSDGTIRMAGYASVTEHAYEIGDPECGGFRETIRRQAFKRTLNESPDVVLLSNHGEGGSGLPMARTKNGSLSLGEDARGLRWTADLDPEDPDSKALARKVEQGLLDECSFAFRCTDDEWDDTFTHRTIKSLSLHRGDVSVVNHGANPATSVSVARAVEVELESRAGKTLSAKTRGELQEAYDKLGALLNDADPADPEPTVSEVAQEAVAALEVEREAEEPESKVIPLPDLTSRRRERLAVLRGGRR